MVADRRLHQRLAPGSPPLVLLDGSKYSLLSDLGEGGLAVEGFAPQDPTRVISLEFDMPQGNGCIQTQAEIVWTSDSGYRTGFRFLDLPDTSRQQLKEWISTASAARSAAIDNELAKPKFASAEEPPKPFPPPERQETETKTAEAAVLPAVFAPVPPPQASSRSKIELPFASSHAEFDSDDRADKVLHVASIFIAAIVISAIAFLLGYFWRGRRSRPPVKPTVAAVQTSQPSSTSAAPAPQPLPPAMPASLPVQKPGLVLQVAAMGKKENADKLSHDLRTKGFSAFVFQHGGMYRVAVGPYAKEGVAHVKGALEQEGYNPIVRPWTPQ